MNASENPILSDDSEFAAFINKIKSALTSNVGAYNKITQQLADIGIIVKVTGGTNSNMGSVHMSLSKLMENMTTSKPSTKIRKKSSISFSVTTLNLSITPSLASLQDSPMCFIPTSKATETVTLKLPQDYSSLNKKLSKKKLLPLPLTSMSSKISPWALTPLKGSANTLNNSNNNTSSSMRPFSLLTNNTLILSLNSFSTKTILLLILLCSRIARG